MASPKQEVGEEWLDLGYIRFGEAGLQALKIDSMAKALKKSRSSFYHLFGDLSFFEEQLMDMHKERVAKMVNNIHSCQNLDPEAIIVFIEGFREILFNRQLRMHPDKEGFDVLAESCSQPILDSLLPLFTKHLNLENNPEAAKELLDFSKDHFLFSMGAQDFDFNFILNYINRLKVLVNKFNSKT